MNIIEKLRLEGKVTELSDEQVAEIRKHIEDDMREFRMELYRKQRQSERDLRAIILSH